MFPITTATDEVRFKSLKCYCILNGAVNIEKQAEKAGSICLSSTQFISNCQNASLFFTYLFL